VNIHQAKLRRRALALLCTDLEVLQSLAPSQALQPFVIALMGSTCAGSAKEDIGQSVATQSQDSSVNTKPAAPYGRVQHLVEQSVSPSSRSHATTTPYTWANTPTSTTGSPDAQWAKSNNTQRRGDIAEVGRAFTAGADLNMPDNGHGWQCDWNLLQWASANGSHNSACLLTHIIFLSAGHEDAVRELLIKGVDVNIGSV
jgi:hypothetical protein